MSDELRNLEREIRSWTRRPPKRSPRAARTRVLARIQDRRPGLRWWLAPAAATLIAGLAFGLLVLTPDEPSGPPPAPVAERPSPGLLVYQLESGTKLYLALATPPIETPTHPENSTREGNG